MPEGARAKKMSVEPGKPLGDFGQRGARAFCKTVSQIQIQIQIAQAVHFVHDLPDLLL
jgi:hypothetical protein